MKELAQKVSFLLVVVATAILLLGGSASAHVTVKPAEVLTSGFQTFTVGVPNEKEIPTTAVKLDLPEGLMHVSPSVKTGWKIAVEKSGDGHDAMVKSITWSGGSIGEGFRDDFTFSAKVPAEPTELRWNAYQTYQDGTVVEWDLSDSEQPTKEDGSPDFSTSGPYSTTEIVSETQAQTEASTINQTAENAKSSARLATYVAVASLVVAITAIFYATKKQ